MAEFPWFPCYPSDWLSSQTTQFMTLEQEGAFFRLLCFAWLDDACALPNSPKAMLKLCKGISEEEFKPILAAFTPHPSKPDSLHNPRLYKEWLACRERQAILQSRAQKGAEARWAVKPLKLTTKKAALLNGRDYRTESKTILAFLNEKTGKQFREVESNLRLIEARLKSGVDVQTCKTLIARKVRDWTPKPEMQPYLRPETLFNQTKFETYLAEVSS